MHGFKSAILEKWKNCQNGTFQPVHEIQKLFGPKDPGFRSVKVQTEDFLKKDSQYFKNSFQIGFL